MTVAVCSGYHVAGGKLMIRTLRHCYALCGGSGGHTHPDRLNDTLQVPKYLLMSKKFLVFAVSVQVLALDFLC